MKYQDGKIKKEHHIMKEFDQFLKSIEKIALIQRIIPGRVSRKNSGKSKTFITFSYFTPSGAKFLMKKGSTSQEIFVLFDLTKKDQILDLINIEIEKFLV